MRDFVHVITAASLIVHAMIGCCHFHWHGESCQAVEISAPQCSCCHHVAKPQEPSPPPAPCRGEHECHGVCNYLPTHKPTIDGGRVDHGLVALLCVASHESVSMGNEVEKYAEHSELGASPPQLRLHLLNQIFLI